MKNFLRLTVFGALMIFGSSSFGQTVTRTYVSNPTSTSVDGVGNYGLTLPSVSFTAADFPDGCEVTDVDVTISWAKTAGSCAAPTGGNSEHQETSFSITGPSGTEILAVPGTWTGQTTTSSVVTTFSQGNAIPTGIPVTGTFEPNDGDLDIYNGQSPFGDWELNVGDNASGAPLCIDWYSVTITTAADVTAPVLTVPADIVMEPDPQSCGAVVTFADPTATDLCGATIIQTDGPVSGAVFPAGSPTTVTFEAEDPYGNVTIESFTVTVNAIESVAPTSITASSTNICGGDAVQLTVDDGSLGSGAQWLWTVGSCGGELVGGGETITVNPLTTTTYFVQASGPCNTTLCAEVLIEVTEAPSVGFCNVVSPSACGASDGFIEACATGGTGPYTYNWGNATGATLTGLAAGPYSVTVTDAAGCTDVASVALSDPGAEITVLTSSDADNIICQGESVTFTATGSFQYQYYINNDPVSSQNPFVTTDLNDGDVVHVVGIDFDFCSYTAQGIEFTVLDNPVIDETVTDPSACAEADGSILTSVSGGLPLYTYAWVPAATSSGILNLTAGPYFLTVTDANGCSTSETYALNDPGAAPVTVASTEDPDNEICAGESITFLASGSVDYEFFVDGGSVSTDNPYTTSALTDGQSVVATGTDANNCTATSNIIYATVNPGPIISLVSDVPSDTICIGESISFFASGGLIYEFFVDGNSQGAASSTTVFTSSSLTTGQEVTVIGTDAFLCDVSSDTITVTVRPSPTIEIVSFTDPQSCGATDGTITAEASDGTPGYVYDWSHGPSGPTVATLNAGSYFVTVTDIAGCTASTSQSLSDVGSTPVTLTSDVQNNIICGTDPVTFTASGASTYVFYVNGVQVTTQNPFVTDTLEDGDIVAVTGLDTMLCSATSDPEIFTVYPGIEVGTFPINPTACGAMDGSATSLVIGGTPDITYVWTPIVQITPAAVGLGAGPHVLTVIDANGCEASDAFILSDPGTFNITLTANPPELVICQGNEIEFTADGGDSYEFFIGAQSVSTDNPYTTAALEDGDQVSVIATDANNCTATSSLTYIVNTVLQAQLVLPDIACSNEDTVLLTGGFPAGGEYTVVYGNIPVTGDFLFPNLAGANPIEVCYSYTALNGCTSTACELYVVLQAPQINLGNDTTVCGITLDAGSGFQDYQWTSAPDDTLSTVFTNVTGVYGVTVTDANGCVGTDEIGITVNPIPDPVVMEGGNVAPNGGMVEYCINTDQYLYAQTGFDYIWTITGSDSSSTVIPGLAAGEQTITLTVTNDFDCSASTDVVLIVHEPMPGGTVTPPGPLEFCNGESVTLDAGTGYASYLWNTGSTTQTITVFETGCYWPIVLDGNGCIDSSLVVDSVCINVVDPEPLVLHSGDSLIVTNAGDFVSYQWYLNNDILVDETNPVLVVKEFGNYVVCVTDADGCEGCSLNNETDCCVGIEEAFFDGNVYVYPNPNSGQFTLEVEMQSSVDMSVGLYDMVGKQVWLDQDLGNTNSLRKQYDMSEIPDGVYFIRIYADDQMTVQKLIKQQ
ncbi:MAG: T9SS type A sorting domain-containing protein [Flavobacteriales bacterium]|nr:T9SS type A sorting domain-containing protein [Flavobacteriales bacterium]